MARLPSHLAVAPDPHEAAAQAWLARGSPAWTSADEHEFQIWLRSDGGHREAYDAIEDSMGFIDLHAQAPEWDGLRTRARQSRRATYSGALGRRAVIGGALAAAASIAAVVALSFEPPRQTFTTKPGERREIVLSDGSRLTLDSQAVVEARLGRRTRALRMVEGQAGFDVAHDAGRPFTVQVGDHLVVATGTAFNIDSRQDHVAVTLLQGAVEVRPSAGGRPIAHLKPGQQFVVDGARGAHVVEPPNVEVVTAWRSGKLIFDRTPLAEAVGQVNRYAKGPALSVSPAAAGLTVTGAFNTGDSAAFIEAVTAYLPLTASPAPGGRVELRPRTDGPQ